MSEPGRPRGCPHTNTSLEVPGAPEAVMRHIAERTSAIEAAIYAVLRRAKTEGVLDRTVDIRAFARFYLGVAKRMTVLHKVYGETSSQTRARCSGPPSYLLNVVAPSADGPH